MVAMRFANVGWLWGVLVVIVAYAALHGLERKRERQLSQFIDRALWSALIPALDPQAKLRKLRTLAMAAIFAVVAMARPQWGTHEEKVSISGLDIMIVLDVSSSMEVEDVVPSRLKKAKHAMKNLLDRIGGDRVGLLAFAGIPYLASPLTPDVDYIWDVMQGLSPRSILVQGTHLGDALDAARSALSRGAQAPLAKEKSDVPSHAVILVSDGEDHEDGAITEAKRLKDSGVKLFVLGVGTQKGGPVPVRDAAGALQTYKKDRKGQSVVSTFHADALISTAAAADGRYWNLTESESEIDELATEIGGLTRSDLAEKTYLVWEDRFQWPLAIALLLLLWELAIPARKLGVALVWLGVIWTTGVSTASAGMGSYLENRKGLKAYESGQLDEAGKHFGQAQALDPKTPELSYNQGVVQLKKGDADSAIQMFQNAAQGSLAQKKGALTGDALFNLGSALAKKGDTKGATQAYRSAIETAKNQGNTALEKDAKKNLELLFKEEQQKKKQQQEQKQDQNQDQKEQKGGDPKEGGQSKDDKKSEQGQQNQQQQQSQDSNSPQGRKRQFKSEKLSPEDAERVLSELSQKERDLQQKIKGGRRQATGNQTGKGDAADKDW